MQYIGTLACSHGPIEYILRKRRGQKQMALRVTREGVVTLTVPWWVSRGVAMRYLEKKQAWIVNALGAVPVSKQILKKERDAHYTAHKEAARMLIRRRLEELNLHYGFVWGRVAIRRNTTSWGSCSSKKNLNFDYRILFLPAHLQDYIVVHELCHLREMNHSPRFWALVAQLAPQHRTHRAELKTLTKSMYSI